jgi:hypothetical protein
VGPVILTGFACSGGGHIHRHLQRLRARPLLADAIWVALPATSCFTDGERRWMRYLEIRRSEVVKRPASPAATPKVWLRHVQGMRSIALGVLVCLAVGCSERDQGAVFRTALPQEVDEPLPVVLHDTTGLVRMIGPAVDSRGDDVVPELVPDPTDPKAFVITWLGGPCESEATLSFTSAGEGYVLVLGASHEGSCPLIGYPRGVRISTTVAIPIRSIEVTGRG